jgi:hypothetical protein
MDNKTIAADILSIFNRAESIIKKAESGIGLGVNLSEEQKIKFQEEMKKVDLEGFKKTLEEKKQELKETTKKMNNVPVN